jgi:hypothetical protein
MRYETMQFILKNKRKLVYDSFAATGSDNSTDATAATVDVNASLAPVVGGTPTMQTIVIIGIVLIILYLCKDLFYGNNIG